MITDITILKPNQIIFAEWLATSQLERQPKTQTELALQLGVTEATLINWKKLPELWDYRDSILRHAGKDLVPEALKVMAGILKQAEQNLKENRLPENSKVALETAKDVLSRWSDPKRSAHIVATLKDMYRDIDKETKEGEHKELKGE